MIVKSVERNAANMYEARRQLLGLSNESLPITSISSNPILSPGLTTDSLGLTNLGKL